VNNLSVNQVSSLKWDFFKDVIQYAKRGFDGIGLWRSKIDDISIQEAGDFLQEMKMNVTSVGWVGGFTGAEGLSFHQAIDDAIEGIEATAELRGRCLILHPGSQSRHTPRHARRLLDEALKILVPVAESCGVTLAVEPMVGIEQRTWSMLSGVMETLAAIENYSPNQVGIVLDFYHSGADPKLVGNLAKFVDRIQLVQIADRRGGINSTVSRCLPGCGDLGLQSWIRLLSMSGYTGPIEAEIFGTEVQHLGYPCVLDASWEYLAYCREIHRSVKSQAQKVTK
jgi:sugar phosphate isomerase/epimerase